MAYARLPQYRTPGPLNFEPVNRGLDALGQSMEKNRLLKQREQIGEAIRSGDYETGAETAFGQGNLEMGLSLQQARRQAEADKRQQAQFGQTSQLRGLQIEKTQADLRSQVVTRAARLANLIKSEPDPERKAQMAEKFFNAHPRFRSQLDSYGVDLSNPDTALDFIIAEAGSQGKPTDDIREYEYAQRDPAFMEYQRETKKPLVSIEGEKKYEQTRGEALAKEYGELQSGARQAQDRIGQLRAIDDLLSDPAVYTGTGARSINAVKRAGQTLFGMDFEGVDKADAAQRFVTEMALSFRQDLPGPMSDADRQFLTEIPPNIGDTAQGRKLLVEMMQAKERRKIELAELARRYRQQRGRLDDGWHEIAARYAEENPLFGEEMMARAKEVAGTAQQASPYAGVYPSVESDEDFDALESGELFVDPDGQVRRKP